MEPEEIIDEVTELRRVLLSELGDFIVPVVSLVSEPSIPWARYISVKSAEPTKTGEEHMEAFDFSGLNPLTLLRMKHKISQVDLAAKSGVPQSTLSTYENGTPIPRSTIEKLAPHLGVSAEDLGFMAELARIKARAQGGDPGSMLAAASDAFDLSENDALAPGQRDLASKLCADLLRKIEAALGIEAGEAADFSVAQKSAEQPIDTGRDANGNARDKFADLKLARRRL